MENILWGAFVRMAQAALQASPTILVGILVAAIFQRILGREQTFRLFGGRTWRQIPQAWAMGMLLPVCSLGAIPVMSELRRAGLVGGTILAFGLTAPIFNPLSVLYGLTLSHPMVILTICICSLVIVTVMGLVWDRLFRDEYTEIEQTILMPYGIRRVLAVFLAMFRISYSRDLIFMILGLVGVGFLGALLPANSLQTSAERSDLLAPVRMALIALPAYITPMNAMMQLASMFQHGNSIAAAFTLLILGTGLNLGVCVWIARTYSWTKASAWIAMTMLLVLFIAYAIEGPLYPKGVKPEGHTHAFDHFCRPISNTEKMPASSAWKLISEKAEGFEVTSIFTLAFFVVTGSLVWWLDPKQSWEERLAMNTNQEANTPLELGRKTSLGNRDIVLPPRLVGSLALGGLIAASIAGCYIYYPTKESVFEDLAIVNAEVCTRATAGDWGGALFWIPTYEDWLRKLQVGLYLRGQSLDEEQYDLLHKLEEHLEELEHASKDKDLLKARTAEQQVRTIYYNFRISMSPQLRSSIPKIVQD